MPKTAPKIGSLLSLRKWCFKEAFPSILGGSSLLVLATIANISATLLFRPLFDKGLAVREGEVLIRIMALQLSLLLVRSVLAGFAFDVFARVGARLGQRLTLMVFDHLLDHPLSYFLARPQAELLQVLRNDVLIVEQSFAQLIGQAIIATSQTLVIILVLLIWEPRIALLCLVGLGVSSAIIWFASRLTSRTLAAEIQANTSVAEHLLMILGLRGFFLRVSSSPAWARTRLQQLLQTYREAMVRRRVLPNWALVSGEGVGTITYFCFYLVAAFIVTGGNSTIGSLVAMAAMISYLIGSMSQLAPTYVGLADAWVRLSRLERELQDHRERRPDGCYDPLKLQGTFELNNVTVHYGETAALKAVSLSMSPGRIVAIVGPSGAGKTTVTLLLLGLIEPECGLVTADRVPLNAWKRDALWRNIGYVPQEPILIHGSARDNIAAGRLISEAQIIAASVAAGIHNRLSSDPAGYSVSLGENGFRLSAGERQRLALARALAGSPSVLVLDEPTANLDAGTEAVIHKTLADQRDAGRSVIVVTHNPSTLAIADDVIVLERGTLTGCGPIGDPAIQVLLSRIMYG
jgi:ABC-type bacteriocin/lantibiotic exporter with double-glycine peptidase domain